ncbi:MAG: hypothetical protein SGPRY_003860 [Prymnesium sp.]
MAAPQEDSAMAKFTAAAKPFAIGSAAGCIATCLIQPMDMIKVRIQLASIQGTSTNPMTIGYGMVAKEGFGSLYAGLSAGLARQVVYTGSRLGLYDKLTDAVKEPGKPLPLAKTAGCAIVAGGLAAVVGTPADLALIRMQADTLLPEAERRGYTNVFSALSSIARGEGFMGLFKGAGPTATRAMALNLGMLGGNTEAKKHLSAMGLTG